MQNLSFPSQYDEIEYDIDVVGDKPPKLIPKIRSIEEELMSLNRAEAVDRMKKRRYRDEQVRATTAEEEYRKAAELYAKDVEKKWLAEIKAEEAERLVIIEASAFQIDTDTLPLTAPQERKNVLRRPSISRIWRNISMRAPKPSKLPKSISTRASRAV